MLTTETKLRVRYAETDKMNFVYYGNYAQYYEIGRTEMLRHLGFTYKNLEDKGIILPVLTLNTKYLKSASYDNLLTIRTTIKELPKVRIKFYYEIFNENNELINSGDTTLVFVDTKKNKPVMVPDFFLKIISKYFK